LDLWSGHLVSAGSNFKDIEVHFDRTKKRINEANIRTDHQQNTVDGHFFV